MTRFLKTTTLTAAFVAIISTAGAREPGKGTIRAAGERFTLKIVGDSFPGWKGHLIAGSLAGQKFLLRRLSGNEVASQETILNGTLGRIRDVRAVPDALVFVLTDDGNASLWRIEPIGKR